METVKLIEPTYGRIVTLQVLREEPFLRDMSIRMLTAIADGEKIKAKVSGNTVTLTFSDVASADAYKEGFKLNQKKSLKRGK